MKTQMQKLILSLAMLGLVQVVNAQRYGDFYISTNGDGTCAIEAYAGGYNASVLIPQSINGIIVTSIESYAFYQDARPISVTMGNSVTNIGDGAFYGCFNLKKVTIGGGVIRIGESAFENCLSLNIVTIPDSVTTIENYAFSGCYLGNLTIPNSVTTVGNYAFVDNPFTKLTIPDSVTSIGKGAFAGCSHLTNVTISDRVAYIGTNAFRNCTSLQQAYFQGNAPSVNGGAGSADSTVFAGESGTAYHVPGTTVCGVSFCVFPIALWDPQATTFSAAGEQFGFNITGPTNAVIVVEACTNFANPVWLPVSTNTLTGGASSFSDSQSSNYSSRFYRFRSP